MDMPRNDFKRRLADPDVQYGIWVSLADPVSPIARLVHGDTHRVKHYLDIGFQTILVPMVAAVRAAVVDLITRIRAADRPCGVLATTPESAEEYQAAGANFIGLAVDTALLATATSAITDHYLP